VEQSRRAEHLPSPRISVSSPLLHHLKRNARIHYSKQSTPHKSRFTRWATEQASLVRTTPALSSSSMHSRSVLGLLNSPAVDVEERGLVADLEPAEDGAFGLPRESPRRIKGLLHDSLEGFES
jgi:hypothetical protein